MKLIKLIVFRFSSFGDVAMTVPVIKDFIIQNPNCEIIFVSNQKFEPLFNKIENIKFYGINLNNYKGFTGLFRLFMELKKFNPIIIIDLHNVLRTKIIRFFFRIIGIKNFTLNKGRKEKKILTQKNNKILNPLKSMHQRYADVFINAGFKIILNKKELIIPKNPLNIGIAPFARYKEKMFPLEKMKQITLEIAEKGKIIYLFGGGKDEIQELKKWEYLHKNIISLAGKMNLSEELNHIKKLDVLISMDSANMHLASLVNIPCISIWGATHYFAGFLGFNQSIENIIQENVSCRPCSVFGNKRCFRNDLLCMNSISEQQIISKIIF